MTLSLLPIPTDCMGHDSPGHNLVHTHHNIMIVVSILAGIITLAKIFLVKKRSSSVCWLHTSALYFSFVVLVLGTDRGAELVFRYGVDVKIKLPRRRVTSMTIEADAQLSIGFLIECWRNKFPEGHFFLLSRRTEHLTRGATHSDSLRCRR